MQLSQIIERLAKLQRVQRLVGYGATYMVVLLLYVFLFYLPKNSDLGTLQTEQANLIKQKQQVEDRVKNKAARDAELQQLNADLTAALKELPNDREIPGLLKGISTLGKKVGLEVKKFQPLPEVKKEYVAEVPVQLEVEGAYHEVGMFFDRLAKMNRIVYVQDIEMSAPQERGGKVVLAVSGNVVTFRFLTDEEIAEQVAAEKAKKGGRKGKPAAAAGGEE